MNKTNITSDSCQLIDLDISVFQGKFNTHDYDKSFFFPCCQFSFYDGDVPLAPSYGVYISQLVHIAHIYNVSDFNLVNITEKQKNFYTKVTAFINYWKLSLNFITAIKILYIKCNSICRYIWSNQKGYFPFMLSWWHN